MQNRKRKLGFPHPLIKHLGDIRKWKPSEERSRMPCTYEQFQTDSDTVGCPHMIRSSMSVVGASKELHALDQPTIIVQPFAPCCKEVPQLKTLVVCPSCKMPINILPAKTPIMEGYCNTCRLPLELNSETGYRLQQQLNTPVFDCAIGECFDQPERYVFVIELSQLINKNGQLQLLASSIAQLYQNDRECEIAFVVAGQQLFSVTCSRSSHDDEQAIWSGISNPQDGLPMSNPYLSTSTDSGRIDLILRSLEQYLDESFRRHTSSLTKALQLVAGSFDKAKVLVFSCLLEDTTKCYLQQGQSVPYPTVIRKLCQSLTDRNLGICLFVFDFGSTQLLESISPLAIHTGGTIEYYKCISHCCGTFYYDLHRTLANPFYWDVTLKIAASNDAIVPSIVRQLEPMLSFPHRLATMDPQTSITISLKQKKTVQAPFSVTIAIYYSTTSQRRVRCFQHYFSVSTCSEDVITSISDEALLFSLAREIVTDKSTTNRAKLQKAIQRIRPIIKNGEQQGPNQLGKTVPSNVKHTCFYLAELLKSGLIGNLSCLKPNEMFFRQYTLTFAPLQTIAKGLCMKLYKIDSSSGPPKNIKFEASKIEYDGIYLVDNGRFLFLLVGEDVTTSTLQEIVGISQPEEVDLLQHIPRTSHQINSKLSSAVQLLRAANLNCYLQLKGVREGSVDYHTLIAPALYLEDEHRRLLIRLTT